MKLLRSGKRNMLNASARRVLALDNPIKEISTGHYKPVIDSTSKIFNASAGIAP